MVKAIKAKNKLRSYFRQKGWNRDNLVQWMILHWITIKAIIGTTGKTRLWFKVQMGVMYPYQILGLDGYIVIT